MRLDNVFNDDNPLKSVRQVHQGFLLLLAFFGGRYFKGGLNVEQQAPFIWPFVLIADVSSGDFITLAKAKEVFKTVFE